MIPRERLHSLSWLELGRPITSVVRGATCTPASPQNQFVVDAQTSFGARSILDARKSYTCLLMLNVTPFRTKKLADVGACGGPLINGFEFDHGGIT